MTPSQTVAIVGIGGEFPKSPDLDRFWDNIVHNVNTADVPPKDRWILPLEEAFDPEVGARDHVYSRKACFLDPETDTGSIGGLDLDPEFLASLDPMYRLLLRVGQKTITDAKRGVADRSRAGIIIGNLALPSEKSSALARYLIGRTFTEKLSSSPLTIPEGPVAPLNQYVAGLPASLAARAFGFERPSFTIDAACASSLYAIKLAVDELISGRADAMLAGGLSRPDSLYTQMGFSQLRALSPTGTCAPFDRNGNGLVVGEGCGLVLLKRTEDAVRDGDHIYATIQGIGLSNDLGGNLLAPASEGQQRAMRAAYKQAGWSPDDVDLIECHATGTPVGDIVEFNSLRELWQEQNWHPGQCVIGSVKANIGHLLTAAGSAALMKTLLAMKQQILPPMVNFSAAAEGIDLAESPFRILNRPEHWEVRSQGEARRAAVSAFGFGGINAHLLLEEWIPNLSKKRTIRIHPSVQSKQQPIAIVGLGAHVGPWINARQFHQRFLKTADAVQPEAIDKWWGAENSRWMNVEFPGLSACKGFTVDKVQAAAGEFRIPPRELEEMLPRQLLMLKVAAAALKDAGLEGADLLFSGVFVGCGLDLNATNFSFRWALQQYAWVWADELGLDLSDEQLTQWIGELRDSSSPPLTANRTMGALGSTVASRIAKEFRIGGPSFTLSSEETSGLQALDAGIRALQDGSINRAIVGAVDFPADLRAVVSRHAAGSLESGTPVGEGAVAVILKRLEDATQDGDRIYAVIDGIDGAVSGSPDDANVLPRSMITSLQRSCRRAGIKTGDLGALFSGSSGPDFLLKQELPILAEQLGENHRASSLVPFATADHFGDLCGAGGLAALVQAALSLHHRVLPSGRGHSNELSGTQKSSAGRYWLHNRDAGPRRALVSDIGPDGSAVHAILKEYHSVELEDSDSSGPLVPLTEALFIVEGDDSVLLKGRLERLKDHIAGLTGETVYNIGRLWFDEFPPNPGSGICLSLIASDTEQLNELINYAEQALNSAPDRGIGGFDECHLPPALRDRIFFAPQPLGRDGKVAFVFPGSGNHFAGMGRELSLFWPDIYRKQEKNSLLLADQYQPWRYWVEELDGQVMDDHNSLVISHVALCTALHDLLRSFNVEPQMISGYSLGESSGLFSSRAWQDRDGMLKRLEESPLFTEELAGQCKAARRIWNLPREEKVDWSLGIVNIPAGELRESLKGRERVYLLIVNSYRECVVGGQRADVDRLIADLGCHFIPLQGVTTVHCEVTKAVAEAYRNLHLFPVTAPAGIDFYSCALGKKYPLTAANAADVILAQALDTINYPQVIEKLYDDGARLFLEVGPGQSCSRMINSILGDRPHVARGFCAPGLSQVSQLLRLLGHCLAERIPVDMSRLYIQADEPMALDDRAAMISVRSTAEKLSPPSPPRPAVASVKPEAPGTPIPDSETMAPRHTLDSPVQRDLSQGSNADDPFGRFLQGGAAAHESYLSFAKSMEEALSQNIRHQMSLLQQLQVAGETVPDDILSGGFAQAVTQPVAERSVNVAFDRDMCMEFAIGSVGKMLGPEFAPVDRYPTRVRLPDEPLMLVDRIMSVEGEPKSMTHGRVVTEHDVTADRWYLDGQRIPTCVAVEAGQADLFLSGYLGIDFITGGKAVYRLLDAVVTFHRGLPQPGDTIRYDIRIHNFFRQDQTYLFRFSFEGTVNGEPLLSMEKGCAGFFTAEELAAGRGIVHTKLDLMPQPGKRPADWVELVPMQIESYNDEQINALYQGDLGTCFGDVFTRLPVQRPYTLPGGHLKLVDRVTKVDPEGGRYGLGQIVAEMDIQPDDWFLTCHFVDDRVMPGTLMYECCLHTLRIYLMRMGWIGEADQTWCEPVPGVASGLKCRGQVTEDTKTVTYQVSIKELGYGPEPFAIVDALMFADGHPIVEIPDMSVRFAGLDRAHIEQLWAHQGKRAKKQERTVLYDTDRITAFAIGKPSEAFGDRYRVFDEERRIARLPGPPFQFLDRIVAVDGEPWKLVEGVSVEAEYDVPPDAWYFAADRQPEMPFSVLLEIGLQPCGWLAAYLGSALTSPVDLSFRNLDGNAMLHRQVTPDTGTLTIAVKITRIASSGGMIIQGYDFQVSDRKGPVYEGDTVFGFFSKESLAQQVGVRGVKLYQPSKGEEEQAERFSYPETAPFPEKRMRMIDEIDLFIPAGGPQQLGYIRGIKHVDPEEWFFKAHFYQDPVCPGSLGLESFLQLLKVVAAKRWQAGPQSRFETVACGKPHKWNYRGQIIPDNELVTVEALITGVDEENRTLTADGVLVVDGKVIYQLKDFTLRLY